MASVFRAALALMLMMHCHLGAAVSSPPQEYSQLAEEVDRILQQTRTPGAAIALIEPGGSVWRYTTGFKNIAHNEPVDPSTIFRVGSVSKIFVSLAVMKLVAEGGLSLQDRLAEVAPEVEFYNPWEDQHPVRVVHLLNHTSGWDAPHAPELVAQSGEPPTIAEVLALHPHSRESRWIPGSRTAYNNTGPLVAAYLVEKLTGKRFEKYVQAHFFDPLGMTDSGYFFDDRYRSHSADLYRGSEKLSYWHLPNRAAGGMHSSLDDMIQLLAFLQNPDGGEIPSVLPGKFVRMMEEPNGTSATDAGLQIGWGFGLTSFHHEGEVWYGHEGALPGARALVAYQPNNNAGHVILTNGDSPAAGQIHKLLAEHRATQQEASPIPASDYRGKPDSSLAGFYRVISPVAERFRIAHSLLPWKISIADSGVKLSPLVGGASRNLAVSESGQYLQPYSGRVALVQVDDPLVGKVVHYGPMTLQKTNAVIALVPAVLLAVWLASIAVGVFQLLFWLVRKVFGGSLSKADACIRRWSLLPLIGILMAAAGAVMNSRSSEPYALSVTVSMSSMLIFLGTLVFLAGALGSLHVWYRQRGEATAGFWHGHATLLIFLNLVFAVYLLGYGLIGVRLWA
ncbi:serine hydrolase [uncultured Microbulbifer sp.]|uniref:serine hydrolase domain-containing protein n=1 Tax=uncultured Microbulbifer sp. TaxID=348147 RepID=UPI002627A6BC|nr:serine hydrolase domain-containing protein [uncultured Microbulbifer sp.]